MMIELPWGQSHSPRVHRLGWFQIGRRNGINYRHPTCALHMHQYRGVVWIGETRLDLAPGDLTISPPDTPSRYELERQGRHWCVHFSLDERAPGTLMLPLHYTAGPHNPQVTQRLAWLAELARTHSSQPSSDPQLAADALETGVRELLLWLHFTAGRERGAAQTSTRADLALQTLAAALERRYERDWSAKDIAAETGLNAGYLARQFRRRYRCTIAQFLLRRRIEAAQHLLRSTTLRVKEIGAAIGIPDPQKFNKDFRRATRASPTEFRLQGNR